MWDCATPATWNQGGCHQVPRLPRKVPRRHGRHARLNRAQAKRPWMWDCATPATWNHGWMSPSATPATQSAAASRASRATKPGPRAPRSAMWRSCVCERWYVTKLCVCVKLLYVKFVCVWSYCMLSLCVCEVIVCEIVCVCEVIVC